MSKVKLLILDRDGTLVRNRHDPDGFINRADDMELMPNVRETLGRYRNSGWAVYVVSNQGGVAFGHKTSTELHGERAKLQTLLPGLLRGQFFAESHEEGTAPLSAYRSLLRKPAVGMLVRVELDVLYPGGGGRGLEVPDWGSSLMVGDREEDRLCAEAAGVAFQWAKDFFGWGDCG